MVTESPVLIILVSLSSTLTHKKTTEVSEGFFWKKSPSTGIKILPHWLNIDLVV